MTDDRQPDADPATWPAAYMRLSRLSAAKPGGYAKRSEGGYAKRAPGDLDQLKALPDPQHGGHSPREMFSRAHAEADSDQSADSDPFECS